MPRGAEADAHRIASSAGRVLHDDSDAIFSEATGEGFVQLWLTAGNDHDLFGARFERGLHRIIDERLAAKRVQDLGERAFHARTLAGRQNDGRKSGAVHLHVPLLARRRS
jgi:hypothetical protein